MPTVNWLIKLNKEPSELLAYSVAALLRFLTPQSNSQDDITVFNGQFKQSQENKRSSIALTVYVKNLSVNFNSGEYKFSESYDASIPLRLKEIYFNLKENGYKRSVEYNDDMFSLLVMSLFKLNTEQKLDTIWNSWIQKIIKFYFIIIENETKGMNHLETLKQIINDEHWINAASINDLVREIVSSMPVIDVHTHLFPESHGSLLLYGIDELLSYHYLVAEYFMVADSSITPESII